MDSCWGTLSSRLEPLQKLKMQQPMPQSLSEGVGLREVSAGFAVEYNND
jgi:hypothetical protein